MQTYNSDWLASSPVFYNEKTGKVSENVNDVIDFRNLEFDPEGFNNYLDFGYSVFQQTPVRHVKFLRHSSRLHADGLGQITIEHLDDPSEQLLARERAEEEVLDLLRDRVRQWESKVEGAVVVPTSGGYDSRLLNVMIMDRSRVQSFSYGLSDDPSCSIEVVYAKKVAEILGTRWEQIELGQFHQHLDEWDGLFGCSAHQHGMYHIEFYRRICERIGEGGAVLSGLIGDAWAGNVMLAPVRSADQVSLLGYSHGAAADSRWSRLKSDRRLLKIYFDENREKLGDPRWCIIEAMRFKLILLSYLVRIPRSLGFGVYAPFLDIDIALGMLNLPEQRRRKRQWQRDFFRKHGLAVEEMRLPVDIDNTLNKRAVQRVPLRPLDRRLLAEVVEPSYVDWVNRCVGRSEITVTLLEGSRCWFNRLFRIPKVGGLMWKVGLRDQDDPFNVYYYAYLTLRSIESLLIRRNKA
jgi:asparagine synthetase B (glutamine-hydrolysing)